MRAENLDNAIDNLSEKYIDFLSRLIERPSVRNNEDSAGELIFEAMDSLRLSPKVVNCRPDGSGKNLVGRVKGRDAKAFRSLVLNAHYDVTPVDDVERWTYPPFSATISDGKIFGRGSLDDKAGVALILMVVECLQQTYTQLPGDLIVQFVVEDETTGDGSLALVERGYTGDGVIICDGSWPERIIYAHLGQLWIDVTVRGEPVAACVENRGVNPIYVAMEFIAALKQSIEDWNASGKAFETIEKPNFINVGSIHSGVWAGSVPASCKMEIQLGFADFSPDEVFAYVGNIAHKISDQIVVKKGLLQTPPVRENPYSELVSLIEKVAGERSEGRPILKNAVTGHADIRHFLPAQTVLYGPGGGGNPHGIDEFYYLDHLQIVAKNLVRIALQWCSMVRRPSSDDLGHLSL